MPKHPDDPTISKPIRNADGTVSYCAQVRVSPFKPTSKTFSDTNPKVAEKAARAWGRNLIATLRTQRSKKDIRHDLTKLTVRDLLREYLDDPETTGLNTYDDKHRLACWWMENFGTRKVLELGVLDLREARAKLSPGRKPATVNRYLSEMRSAWNWGRATGLIPKNEVWPERLMLTEPKARVRFLSDAELTAIDKAARENSLVMWAAIVVSVGTGLRQGELLRLNEADLDLTGESSPGGPRLIVRESKNDDSRSVHLPPAVCDALRELLKQKVRAIGGAVFTLEDGTRLQKGVLNVRWRKIRTAAGIQNFHWHDLRHTCASLLAQGGSTLLEIGATLGHRSPSATAKYAHLVAGAATRGHADLDSRIKAARAQT